MTAIPILYIAGLGHSGSTLLDLLLSSHSRISSVGEIQVLRDPVDRAERRRALEQTPCPCGAPSVVACPYWQGVSGRLSESYGLRLEELDMNSTDADIFARHNTALFEAVKAESGAAVVLDSSKNSDRLDRLARVPGLDVSAIHLVRSPFGVAYSNRRKGRPVYHNAMVYTHNFLYTAIVVQRMRYRVVSYEDFTAAPQATVSDIVRWLGLTPEAGQMNWVAHPHHNIGGNRMRYADDATIRHDDSWRRGLALGDRFGVGAITAPTRLPRAWLYAGYCSARSVRRALRFTDPVRSRKARVGEDHS